MAALFLAVVNILSIFRGAPSMKKNIGNCTKLLCKYNSLRNAALIFPFAVVTGPKVVTVVEILHILDFIASKCLRVIRLFDVRESCNSCSWL